MVEVLWTGQRVVWAAAVAAVTLVHSGRRLEEVLGNTSSSQIKRRGGLRRRSSSTSSGSQNGSGFLTGVHHARKPCRGSRDKEEPRLGCTLCNTYMYHRSGVKDVTSVGKKCTRSSLPPIFADEASVCGGGC